MFSILDRPVAFSTNRGKRLPIAFPLLALLLATISWSAPLNVAVNDLAARGVETSDASIISDRLRSELLNTGRFRVMERGQMDQILKEQAFQQSGMCDQSECAVEIGKLLSVDRMIVGSVGRIGEIYTLQARVLDVGTGEIVFTANQDFEGRIDGLLSQALPKLASRLASVTRTDSAGGKADLYVNASETGADVFLDGTKMGVSPLNLAGIPAGDHRVEVRKGERYSTISVELRPDDVRRLELALEIGMGSAKVFTDPAGADVLLDSLQPLGATPLKAERIPMGPHRLFVTLPGHLPQICSLQVRPQETSSLRLKLLPGALVTISVPVPARATLSRDSSDTIRKSLPGESWLRSGKWNLAVEAGKDWAPWSKSLEVGTKPQSLGVDLVHSKFWNDSTASSRHRTQVLAWRWTLGLATLAAAGAATYCHLEAAHAQDDANTARSTYDALSPGGDFASAKARYNAAHDDNETWSRNALIADIGAGLLAAGFFTTFAF